MMSTMEEEPILDIQNDIEEGELSDSDVGEVEYKPLARPENSVPHFNPSSIMSMNIRDDISDESEQETSSDDSDSDNPRLLRPKKPKIKIKHRSRTDSLQRDKADKYKIWCKTAGEDTLTEDLIGCDVDRNRTCYGVESYCTVKPYQKYNEFRNRKVSSDKDNWDETDGMAKLGNKRNNQDRRNVKLRLGKRNVNQDTDSEHDKGDARSIPDLNTGPGSSNEDVAQDIAHQLREPKDNLILRVISTIGKVKAIEIFKETKRIEEDGGMLIMNGLRRRTPGGVYFFLLKRDDQVTKHMLKEIFAEQVKLDNKKRKEDLAKHRDKEVEQLKQTLNDSVLPVIGTRAEQWLSAVQERAEDTLHVSNPPPSPVTDGRDCSSDADTNHFPVRDTTDPVENVAENLGNLLNSELPPTSSSNISIALDPRAVNSTSYDEDYLDIMCNDDMDLF